MGDVFFAIFIPFYEFCLYLTSYLVASSLFMLNLEVCFFHLVFLSYLAELHMPEHQAHPTRYGGNSMSKWEQRASSPSPWAGGPSFDLSRTPGLNTLLSSLCRLIGTCHRLVTDPHGSLPLGLLRTHGGVLTELRHKAGEGQVPESCRWHLSAHGRTEMLDLV